MLFSGNLCRCTGYRTIIDGYRPFTQVSCVQQNAKCKLTSFCTTSLLSAFCTVSIYTPAFPRSGELRTQKLKSHLVRTQSLNVLLFNSGVGQYTAIHATLTARDFFLLSTLLGHSPAFFPKPLLIFHVLVVANTWFLCRPAE